MNAAIARATVSTTGIKDGLSHNVTATTDIRDGTSNISAGTGIANAALGSVDAILVAGAFGDSFSGGVFVG